LSSELLFIFLRKLQHKLPSFDLFSFLEFKQRVCSNTKGLVYHYLDNTSNLNIQISIVWTNIVWILTCMIHTGCKNYWQYIYYNTTNFFQNSLLHILTHHIDVLSTRNIFFSSFTINFPTNKTLRKWIFWIFWIFWMLMMTWTDPKYCQKSPYL
jgi:hypothetical protein